MRPGDLAELEIVLGMLGSASALYGFTIAYYVFARGLQLQEETAVWAAHRREDELLKTSKSRDNALAKIADRRVKLNLFLICSTALFYVSVLGDLWFFVVNPQPLYIDIGVASFFFLTTGITGWFTVLGYRNRRETLDNKPRLESNT